MILRSIPVETKLRIESALFYVSRKLSFWMGDSPPPKAVYFFSFVVQQTARLPHSTCRLLPHLVDPFRKLETLSVWLVTQ